MAEDLSDLADGLEDRERAARPALIEGLLDRGCTPGEIRGAHERGRLALLPLELTLRDEGSRSLEEIGAEHGVDPEALEITRRALGLPAERGQPLYGRAVDGQAQRLRNALDAGVPLEALVTINRVVGRAMATIASAARDTMETLLAQTDVDESVRALRAAEATEALLPDFEQVLVYALGEHVRELVRLEAGDLPRIRAGAAAGPARHRAGDWYGRTVNLASRLSAGGTGHAQWRARDRRRDPCGRVDAGGRARGPGLRGPVEVARARP